MPTLSELLGRPLSARMRVLLMLAVFAVGVIAAAATMAIGAGITRQATSFGDAAPLILVALPVVPLLMVGVVISPVVGIVLALASFPTGSFGMPTGFITVQLAEGVVFLVAMLVIVRRLAIGKTPLVWATPLTWAAGLLAWMLISLYSAVDEGLALKRLLSVLGGVLFAAVVLTAVRDGRDLRRVLAAFVMVACVISVAAFQTRGDFETAYGGSQVVAGRLQGAFDSPNQLGSFTAMALMIAVGLAFGARTGLRRVMAYGAAAVILGALLLSLSRGAWIATALGFAFLVLTLPEARRLLFALSIPLAVTALLAGSAASENPQVQIVGERARAITERSPYDGRDAIWSEALRETRADPLTGQGPGGFPVASRRVGAATTITAVHAHNLWLTWAAEAGIPAILILFGFSVALALVARQARRTWSARGDPRERAVAAALGAALLTVLGQGMFDYTLTNPVVHLAFWTVVGAVLAAHRYAAESSARWSYGPVK